MDLRLLTPENALIFRATHIDNVPWILDHGLHAASSELEDPSFRTIGDPELIARRPRRTVDVPPGGTLGDYVPFYFTPFSPMLYKIVTGHGIEAVPREQLVVLASSVHLLAGKGIPYVLSDRHAYLAMARFSNDLGGLERVPWEQLRARDFARDSEDHEKFDRYQAEALVHRHLPLDGLLGIACYDAAGRDRVAAELTRRGRKLTLIVDPDRFFG